MKIHTLNKLKNLKIKAKITKKQKSHSKETKKQFYKVGDNKFDMFNTHLPQMMPMMTPQYNPYMIPGKFQINQQYMPKPVFDSGIPLVDSSDVSIITFLEQYLSLENLNKDLYLRNRIDENGFIDCDEIVNHNKFKKLNISIMRLVEVLNENAENPVIEAMMTTNEKIVVRNRDYEGLKDKLMSKEQIYQQKKTQPKIMNNMVYNPYMNMGGSQGMNLNYVTLQNNYFFTGMPQEGNVGYNPMYVQYPYEETGNGNVSNHQTI